MKNKQLRESYYIMGCVICGYTPSDPSHVRSYASTLSDHPKNLVPLCRQHHSEQHQIGIMTFINKYDRYRAYLEKIGWEITDRLYHPEINQK